MLELLGLLPLDQMPCVWRTSEVMKTDENRDKKQTQRASFNGGQAPVKTLLDVPLVTETAMLNWWQEEPRKLMSTIHGPYDAPCTSSKTFYSLMKRCLIK